MNRKKELERLYVEAFLLGLGCRDWHSRRDDFESPDFLFDTPDGVIGIEVTTLNVGEGAHGSQMLAAEAEHRKFLRRLAREYYGQGGAPLRVQLLYHGQPAYGFIPSIVATLRRYRPQEAWQPTRFELDDLGGSRAVFYLTSLPETCQGYDRWKCVSDSIGWVRRIRSDVLAARIRSKARHLSRYRNSAERVLLLIVVDRTRSSGMLALPDTGIVVDGCGFTEVHVFTFPAASCRVA